MDRKFALGVHYCVQNDQFVFVSITKKITEWHHAEKQGNIKVDIQNKSCFKGLCRSDGKASMRACKCMFNCNMR